MLLHLKSNHYKISIYAYAIPEKTSQIGETLLIACSEMACTLCINLPYYLLNTFSLLHPLHSKT